MKKPDGLARILVPVDGSEYSRFAAAHAVRLARIEGAEVLFLHVVDEQIAEELAQCVREGDGRRIEERLQEHGRTCLSDVAQLAEADGVPHRELLAEGDPCAVICDTATRENSDLIVVGRIGRRGARRILMGSITRRVIESTDRPVLVVTSTPHDAAA
jgi:nucleotide-binding universal stress UspA family protein